MTILLAPTKDLTIYIVERQLTKQIIKVFFMTVKTILIYVNVNSCNEIQFSAQ